MTDIEGSHAPLLTGRHRLLVSTVVRGAVITALLTAAYFLLPMKRLAVLPLWVIVVVGVSVLIAVTVYELRAIAHADSPELKAVEAVILTGPLLLLMFASTYFVMSQASAANFNSAGLSRIDAMYFTVTIFASVGFGDIVATSQSARLMVTVQMILDLILIGAVVRAFVGAARLARRSPATPPWETGRGDES